MNDLASTQGIVAIIAGVIAVCALCLATVLAFRLRRLTKAQEVVLAGKRDNLVEHAAYVDKALGELRELFERAIKQLENRIGSDEQRIDETLSYRAVIRFDAYEQLGGRQSSSVALLDNHGSGVVLSSINQRDHGRVYAKQIRNWQSEIELLPEEQQAIEAAAAAESAQSQ